MKGHGHDSVCEVKGFLDAIAMVNVYVNVKNPGVVPWTSTEQEIYVTNRHGKDSRRVTPERRLTWGAPVYWWRCHWHSKTQRPTPTQEPKKTFNSNELNREDTHQYMWLCSNLKLFGMMQTSGPVYSNVTNLENKAESASVRAHTFNWPRSWRPWQF